MSEYIAEARAFGIEVLAAGCERKPGRFRARARERQQAIRFGLAAIKGVGEVAVESILKARDEGGKFKSLADCASAWTAAPSTAKSSKR